MVERRGDVGTLREVPRPSRTAVAALAVAAIAFVVAVLVLSGEDGLPDPDPVAVIPADARDPFAYDESRRADFERRAAAGHAHTLYAKSPGGVVESARRTAAFRAEIERAAPAAGVSTRTCSRRSCSWSPPGGPAPWRTPSSRARSGSRRSWPRRAATCSG